MNDEMTVGSAAALMVNEIDRFNLHWQHMHDVSPEAYPERLNLNEWYEQFEAWASMQQRSA